MKKLYIDKSLLPKEKNITKVNENIQKILDNISSNVQFLVDQDNKTEKTLQKISQLKKIGYLIASTKFHTLAISKNLDINYGAIKKDIFSKKDLSIVECNLKQEMYNKNLLCEDYEIQR